MMGSVNYITTIINLRAPGMTLFRMPMSIWAMFITAILQAFALPVLTVALILQLAISRGREFRADESGVAKDGLPYRYCRISTLNAIVCIV